VNLAEAERPDAISLCPLVYRSRSFGVLLDQLLQLVAGHILLAR